MSKVIPDPVRPAPRRRNTFEQAAQGLSAESANATTSTVTQPAPAAAEATQSAPPVPDAPSAAPQPVAPAAVAPPVAAQQPPAAQPAPAAVVQQAAPPVEKKRKKDTMDILLSVPEDLKQRMVATLEHTRPRTGITSQQQFIRTAIEQLCKRLEQELNNGEQYPAPADQITL